MLLSRACCMGTPRAAARARPPPRARRAPPARPSGGPLGRAAPRRARARAAEGSAAAERVNAGLKLFDAGKTVAALDAFMAALELQPSNEEKKAALYNAACCYAKLEQTEDAVDSLRAALECGLQYATVLADGDLQALRGSAEFAGLKEEVVGGGDADGGSFRRDLKLINEARSPFRPVRGFLYVALGSAAFISTLITLPRLAAALAGDEGVTLVGVLQNLGINVAGLVAIFFLYRRDQDGEAQEISTLTIEETLSRLPISIGGTKQVQLCDLRSNARPVVLAGSAEKVGAAVRKAQKYRNQLEERGLLLVPFIIGSSAAQKEEDNKGFGSKARKMAVTPTPKSATREGGKAEGGDDESFDAAVAAATLKTKQAAGKRFKAEPPAAALAEWERTIEEMQRSVDGVGTGDDIFLVLRLDGRVRASGKGMPDWEQLIQDVPKSTELFSKLESG